VNEYKEYNFIMNLAKIFIAVTLILYGNLVMFILSSAFIYLLMVFRAIKIDSKKRYRFMLIITYSFLLSIQIVFTIFLLNSSIDNTFEFVLKKIVLGILLILPYLLEKEFTIKTYTEFGLPNIKNKGTISFNSFRKIVNSYYENLEKYRSVREGLSKENIEEVIKDLPRHNSFSYISNGNLKDEYFKEAEKSLEDLYIYIVISNTGSGASEIISVFTKKQYNHVSLSFDKDLKTIISYNGGEKIYSPGLNKEMIEFFNKKDDSSIIVYKLNITREKKEKLIKRVEEINKEGSAYNILGLIIKQSFKQNIMFCSQFVYSMLKYVELDYFEKKETEVKPTDFVELDYYRKLEFDYEIKFK
jgi:hypothetical protein